MTKNHRKNISFPQPLNIQEGQRVYKESVSKFILLSKQAQLHV
jgi:hypothetical protein